MTQPTPGGLDGLGEPRQPPSRHKWLLVAVAATIVVTTVWIYRNQPFDGGSMDTLRRDADAADPLTTGVADTIRRTKNGAHLWNIIVQPGIRAMDGEVASEGEIKIMLNVRWQEFSGAPRRREAMDQTAAGILAAVLAEHDAVQKIRLVLKVPKPNKDIGNGQNLGVAEGHESIAKMLSFTRSAYAAALRNDSRLAHPIASDAAPELLALGDYVVLVNGRWQRGY